MSIVKGKTCAWLLSFGLFVVLSSSGCNDQAEQPSLVPTPQEVPSTQKRHTEVVVPDFVQGRWQAVKVSVQDKENNHQQLETVPIGGDLFLPDSDIRLRVVAFLPHFIMDGMQLTSVSNAPKNPAAQIIIYEKDQEVFRGWLFGLYPNTHSFQHPRYSFSLLDYVANPVQIKQKGVDKPETDKR